MSDSKPSSNGVARVLEEAPPDTPLQDLPQLLDEVQRWKCARCGKLKFNRPVHCGECGGTRFEEVRPGESDR